MIPYDEVFDLVKNGDWTLDDFVIWLDTYDFQSWNKGYTEGYYNATLDNGGV